MTRQLLRIATAGSVDDGKSTLIGRLLYDSKAVMEDQLAAVERANKAEQAAIAAVNAPSENLERLLASLRPQAIESRNTIREVYRDVEVPTDCAVPAAGVGVLEATRLRANAATSGEPVPVVQPTP